MLNPVTAVCSTDPYDYYTTLAGESRLRWIKGMWVAASPALVMEVMTHPACLVRPPSEPVPIAIAKGSAGEVFGALVRMNDGERHAVPKTALQRGLAQMPPELVRTTTTRISQELAGAALMTATYLSNWMLEVPVRSVASLMGFNETQLPMLALWMKNFVACLSPLSSTEQIETSHRASLNLLAAFRTLLDSPRSGSLLEKVVQEARSVGWDSDHAILANLIGLLSQTYEATAGLIGNCVVSLQRGGAWSDDMEALVHDVARLDPPIQNTRRYVAEDAQVGGIRVERGQMIIVLLAAASRDARADGRIFGFGYGMHACPGQALAETIAVAALKTLPSLPRLHWRYRPSVNARIPEFFEVAE